MQIRHLDQKEGSTHPAVTGKGGAEDKVDGPCMVPRLQGTWGGHMTLLL